MAERPEAPDEPSLLQSARRVVAEASTLVRTEAALARLETTENASAAAGVLARFGLVVLFLGLSIMFLVLAALVALAGTIGWIPAFLLLAAVQGSAALLLLARTRRRMAGLSILPERTIGRISADLKALSALGRSGGDGDGAGVEPGKPASGPAPVAEEGRR
ncbi:phage holin family protein [Thermaurantiacus sp.]